jgi:hypothetical protein
MRNIMAEVLIQNMRNPEQVITIMVTLKRAIIADLGTGDLYWTLEVSTKQRTADNELIQPIRRYITNRSTFTDDVNEAIDELCRQIPWDYIPDTTPPAVSTHWPFDGAEGVPLDTKITINITELAPSSGIDINTLKVKVKGFDLTNLVEVKGDLSSFSLSVTPDTKYKSSLGEPLE